MLAAIDDKAEVFHDAREAVRVLEVKVRKEHMSVREAKNREKSWEEVIGLRKEWEREQNDKMILAKGLWREEREVKNRFAEGSERQIECEKKKQLEQEVMVVRNEVDKNWEKR